MTRPTVVVLRALGLGDLLAGVPALRALREHLPGHHIVLATSAWLVTLPGLAELVDSVLPTSGLVPLDPVVAEPHIAVNLHGRGPQSSRVLDALHPARRIGHSGHGWPGPVWRQDQHERPRWCRLLLAHGIPADATRLELPTPGPPGQFPEYVVVHPGTGAPSRQWPPHRFAEVGAALAGAGHRVAITGNVAELPVATAVAELAGLSPESVLAGRTSLAELAALIAHARLVVSGDTGVAHLTYAYRTASVVLFGPASPRHWGPPAGGPHRALWREDLRRGIPDAPDPDPALLAVDAAEVLAAAAELLDPPVCP